MVGSTSSSTTSSDNDDNDNDTDTDTENNELEKLLPVDIACSNNKNPTREEIRILCNAIPPLHFIFLPQCYMESHARMHTFNKIVALFRNEASQYHEGMMLFHMCCCIAAPRETMETILELYPDAVTSRTIYTKDTALHCYLASNRSETSVADTISTSTIRFLTKKNHEALSKQNIFGMLPIHIAAHRDLSLDIIFQLAIRSPMTLLPYRNN